LQDKTEPNADFIINPVNRYLKRYLAPVNETNLLIYIN